MGSVAPSPWSYILFARPSFLTSFGQFLDFGNTAFEFNRSLNGEQADLLAIKADWLAVGDDIRHAAEQIMEELQAEAATR
jgi:hypothetical protein